VWNTIIQTRETATVLAWKALCRLALTSQRHEKLKDIARTCTRNLAVAYAMAWNRHTTSVFQQAIYLAPTDADLYFELGKVLDDMENWQGAIVGFKSGSSGSFVDHSPPHS
jgi:hypothetical protein